MSIETQLAKQSLEIARLAVKPSAPESNTLEELRATLTDIQAELTKYISESGHMQQIFVVQKIEASLAEAKTAILEQVNILGKAVLSAQQKRESRSDVPEQIEMEFLAGRHVSWEQGPGYPFARARVFEPHFAPHHLPDIEAEAARLAEHLVLLIDTPHGFPPTESSIRHQAPLDYFSSLVEKQLATQMKSGPWLGTVWPHESQMHPLMAQVWATYFTLFLVNQRGAYERVLASVEDIFKKTR